MCVRALALLEHIPSFISPHPYNSYVEGGYCCPFHSSNKHLLSTYYVPHSVLEMMGTSQGLERKGEGVLVQYHGTSESQH